MQMRRSTACSLLIVLAAIVVIRPAVAAIGDDVTLSNEAWTIAIQPATMRVTARIAENASLQLSVGQEGLGSVAALQASGERAQWELPARHVSVRMSLSGAELAVDIRSDQPGEFTWPRMDLGPPSEALIWPYWEGRYVPLDDERWRAFLLKDEWNTLDGLCMPFWGLQSPHGDITFIATNRFNNAIRFHEEQDTLRADFTHTFPKSKSEWACGFVIRLNESTSPVEPAREYRRWLMERGEFVPMAEKLRQTPKAAWLLGAPHVYLWGDTFLSRHDIKPRVWQSFCQSLLEQSRSETPSVGRRVHDLMDDASWKQVEEIATTQWPGRYLETEVANALSALLERQDFYEASSWENVTIPQETRELLGRDPESLSVAEVCRMNGLLLRAAWPEVFLPVEDWGDGVSIKMLHRLKKAGLERMRLCVAGWEGVEKRPEVVKAADEMGYLFGTYDSFHSVHDPALKGTDATWTTAQFDRELYETGGIVDENGKKRGGFKQRGYLLSPHAARPYVEQRVRRNMSRVPYSYYFVDCDAYGQVFDDYAPGHPSTQEQDAAARRDRMAWIRDTFDVVLGSEGGCSFFAPAIHLAEGMLTPVIGWDDSDMKDRDSEYYVGGYYPPDGPRIFVQPSQLKDEYVYLHDDPRFRLPLNEIVFHDAFVSTHHWGSTSLKFTNVRETVALTEMLYQCPPLYHLNLDEFETHRDWIVKHNAFFAPIHREVGFAPMTDFAWLTPDRLVQRTTFDNRIELIANFGAEDYEKDGVIVAGRSAVAGWLEGGKMQRFTPGD